MKRTDGKPVAVLVWVKWVDASYQHGECTTEELDPLIELESAGLLVQETDEVLSLATDWNAEDRTWRHVTHIPRVNIKKIRKVEI